MRFVATHRHSPHEVAPPFVLLARDAWDDYGLKTTFDVVLVSPERQIKLGQVKILRRGQTSGSTHLPDTFERLGDDYCSLGQTSSYYELLHEAGPEVFVPFLTGLRDIALMPEVEEAFSREPGVTTSLLRFPAATRALTEGRATLRPGTSSERHLSFDYELPGGHAETRFTFGEQQELPHRLAVVIGYNGAGKTRLLAHLAMLASHDRWRVNATDFVHRYGRFVGEAPAFGAIVAVSYSAFDDFEVPGQGDSANAELDRERAARGELTSGNYVYVGLRQLDDSGTLQPLLKSIDQLTEEFHSALARARGKHRDESLAAALEPLMREPSFQTIVELPPVDASDAEWRRAFAQLSTGHKIALNIVVQLCAHLERRSLLLLDEPEQHLHPPLLAALLRAIGTTLERHDSFAVTATHSPVVLQEVPARNVKVLRRNLDRVAIEAPEIETFAENVGLLTSHVFNLDNSNTDFQSVLRELAESRTLEEIEELFDGRMSSQARSFVLSIKRQGGAGA